MLKKILISISTIFFLTSCSNSTKKTLGITEEMPNELRVKKAKPLEVPPHLDRSSNNSVSKKSTKEKKESLKELSPAEKALVKEVEEK